MVVLGLLLGLLGTDVNSGAARFTFDLPQLADGIGFVIVAMGMFGLGEIVRNLENEATRSVIVTKIKGLMPTKEDFKRIWAPILRGTALGSMLGILPGSGSILGSFASYSLEKKIAKDPSRFGKGAIEGVAGPESANNAGAQTSFIPMLTLGIPSNPVMALMIGAMIIQGIQPGPSVITEQPVAVLGNHRVDVDRQLLPDRAQPAVDRPVGAHDHGAVPLSLPGDSGVLRHRRVQPEQQHVRYSPDGAVQIRGLRLRQARLRAGADAARIHSRPVMEEYLRRAFIIAHGDPLVFVTRPISATMLGLAVVAMVIVLMPAIRKKRDVALQEA